MQELITGLAPCTTSRPCLAGYFVCRRFPALPPPTEKWETAWDSNSGVEWLCEEKGGEVGSGGGEGRGAEHLAVSEGRVKETAAAVTAQHPASMLHS